MKDKMKKVYFITMCVVTLLSYSCAKKTVHSLHIQDYKRLSEKQKINKREELIKRLEKDSVFMLYNEISNIQLESLMKINPSRIPKNKGFGQTISPTASEKEIYYRSRGVENPKEFIKLDVLKTLTLGLLASKYPDLLNMDMESRIMVLKQAKKPLSSVDILRRKKIQAWIIENNSHQIINSNKK
ncbi:hypothetical protein [Pedobacter arcticus]|uniref:hypothetical protein n=1 Tax=Pedobacter arcticus TaxID=752140 RepID=UPI000361DF38|nr:hypothetical protein [Pedobacter arcticus]